MKTISIIRNIKLLPNNHFPFQLPVSDLPKALIGFVFAIVAICLLPTTEAIAQNQTEVKAEFENGREAYQNEDFEQAIQHLTKAVELNPNYAAVYSLRGNSYLSLKKYDLVIADYAKAIEFNPSNAANYLSRAEAYNKIGKKAPTQADLAKHKELTAQKK